MKGAKMLFIFARGVRSMDETDTTVHESWKHDDYEEGLTRLFFETSGVLTQAGIAPTYEALKLAFSKVNGFSNSVIYSVYHLKKAKDIRPLLNDIETMLYGDDNDARVLKLRARYGIVVIRDRHKKIHVQNAQVIIHQLWEIFNVLKQWGAAQGYFVKKPYDRKYGKTAMQDAAEM